jgi:hypothetical protein
VRATLQPDAAARSAGGHPAENFPDNLQRLLDGVLG